MIVVAVPEQRLTHSRSKEVGSVEVKELLATQLIILIKAIESIIQRHSCPRALVDNRDRLYVYIVLLMAVAVLEFVDRQVAISVLVTPAIQVFSTNFTVVVEVVICCIFSSCHLTMTRCVSKRVGIEMGCCCFLAGQFWCPAASLSESVVL